MSTTATSTTAASTTPASAKPPACLLDELGSSLTWASVVRMMAFLWTAPAALVLVAGARIIFDRPPSPVATQYVDLSRAAAVVLAAFTVVTGGIWLVRSGRALPALDDLNGTWMDVAGHLRFGVLAVIGLIAALVSESGGISLILASVAASAGFVAGLLLPRWIVRIAISSDAVGSAAGDRSGDRVAVCAAVLATAIVFEVTVGWWHSMLMVDGASVLSGVVAIIRGIVLVAAVAAMIVGSRR